MLFHEMTNLKLDLDMGMFIQSYTWLKGRINLRIYDITKIKENDLKTP